MNAIN